MPLIIFGATLVMWLLTKMPILVWAGAALLGWIAGELIVVRSRRDRVWSRHYDPLWLYAPWCVIANRPRRLLAWIKYSAGGCGRDVRRRDGRAVAQVGMPRRMPE